MKGRIIKYKPVAKLGAKKAVQKGGLQDFFNFCIKLPYEEYLKDDDIINMIKTELEYDDIVIDRKMFSNDNLLILVKVFHKTFSNNSKYILDLKKSVMDIFKEHFKEANIFDCDIPSAPQLNESAQSINKNKYKTVRHKPQLIPKIELEIISSFLEFLDDAFIKKISILTGKINNKKDINITTQENKIIVTIEKFSYYQGFEDDLKDELEIYLRHYIKKIILYTFYQTNSGNKKKEKIIFEKVPNDPKNDNYDLRKNKTYKDIKIRFFTNDMRIREQIQEIIQEYLNQIFANYTLEKDTNLIGFRGKTKLNRNKILEIANLMEKKLKNKFPQPESSTSQNAAINFVYGGYLNAIITEYWINHKGDEKFRDLVY